VHHFLEILIRRLKNNPQYTIVNGYSFCQLIKILYYRSKQIIRGFYKRLYFNKINGVFFCGKGVIIEHGETLSAGESLIIENFVYLNALSENGIRIGNNVTIGKNSVLVCTGVIKNKGSGILIGNNCAIGAQSFLGGQGGIEIQDDVIMGPGVKIFSENHNFDKHDILIRLQGESRKGVLIRSNCWIGASVTILDGVKIGDGCVVAAGSVVTNEMPDNSIIAGVPAKVIKVRK